MRYAWLDDEAVRLRFVEGFCQKIEAIPQVPREALPVLKDIVSKVAEELGSGFTQGAFAAQLREPLVDICEGLVD